MKINNIIGGCVYEKNSKASSARFIKYEVCNLGEPSLMPGINTETNSIQLVASDFSQVPFANSRIKCAAQILS